MTKKTKIYAVAFLFILSGCVLLMRAAERGWGFFADHEAVYVHEDAHEEAHEEMYEERHAHEHRSEVKRSRYKHQHTLQAGTDVMIDQRFQVREGDLLEVRVGHADVNIRSHADNEVHVLVTLDARDMDQAKAYFESMNFEVRQVGESVLIETNSNRSRNWSWDQSGRAEITVDVTVPQRFNADLTTAHGDVSISQLTGRIELKASHGDIEAAMLGGESLSVETSHGDIEIGTAEGQAIRFHASHGDIDVTAVAGNEILVRTAHGDIAFDRLEGSADMTNSHGDIRVHFDRLGNSQLSTSHGDIIVSTAPGTGAVLDLSADRVRVASEYRFEGELKKDRADGRINGGGARLEARTSHGHITLRQN